MKLKSDYVERIEERVYELLLSLRYRLELEKKNGKRSLELEKKLENLNLDFALKTFNKEYEVDLLKDTDPEIIFLSLIRNLVNLVCLEEGDANLVLLDIFTAYLQYIDKADKV